MFVASVNSLEMKEHVSYVNYVFIDTFDKGEGLANIKENEELQDAIFGGMLSEMKTLAAE